MRKHEDTRERMLTSALSLLRERGANGVTLDAVLAHSGTPRGSIYHHFPGGRDQLVVDAARLGGDQVIAIVEGHRGDPRAALTELVAFWKQLLLDSDYRAGCPTAALVVDGPDRIPDALDLTRQTFERVVGGLQQMLHRAGAPAEQATSMANVAVAALEGSVILCRVQRSTRPLDDVAALLEIQLAMLGA
jgi:AcrR family transcriptional regulator